MLAAKINPTVLKLEWIIYVYLLSIYRVFIKIVRYLNPKHYNIHILGDILEGQIFSGEMLGGGGGVNSLYYN